MVDLPSVRLLSLVRNHAFHVALHCYRFLAHSAAQFSASDVLALLVAALCHDMDHPGISNKQLVEQKSGLAAKYNNSSVLERHSIALALEVKKEANVAVSDSDGANGAPSCVRCADSGAGRV